MSVSYKNISEIPCCSYILFFVLRVVISISSMNLSLLSNMNLVLFLSHGMYYMNKILYVRTQKIIMNIFFLYSLDENMIPAIQIEDTLREHIFYVK